VWQNSDVNYNKEGGTYSYHRAINGKRRDYKKLRPDCSANNYTVRFHANLNVTLNTLHWTRYTEHVKLNTLHLTRYTEHVTLNTLHWTRYT